MSDLSIKERVDRLLEHGVGNPQKWAPPHGYKEPFAFVPDWKAEWEKLRAHHLDQTNLLFDLLQELANRVKAGSSAAACPEVLPLEQIMHCPLCNARHIDEGEFAEKPHTTHACQSCGHAWRPAVEPTVGVKFLNGFRNDSPKYIRILVNGRVKKLQQEELTYEEVGILAFPAVPPAQIARIQFENGGWPSNPKGFMSGWGTRMKIKDGTSFTVTRGPQS
jgi:hypothetical protein